MTLITQENNKFSNYMSLNRHQLKFLIKNSLPVDAIIKSVYSTEIKLNLFNNLIQALNLNNIHSDIRITSATMSLLLKKKEDSDEYMTLFSNIVKYYNNFYSKPLFSYEHLYQLIIQAWMDLPTRFTNDFRKNLILAALANSCSYDDSSSDSGSSSGWTLPQYIIREFKLNAQEWFVNLKNPLISEMIEWLCAIDLSGELTKIKDAYLKKLLEDQEIEKAFKKKFNKTRQEYEIKQHQAKINGLCRFVRDGTLCPHSTNCIFYHGNLAETYAIQPCRKGDKCQFLLRGECKFVHRPTDNQLKQLTKFYDTLTKQNFCMTTKQSIHVDDQCKKNPFLILKKVKETEDNVQYSIPKCSCVYVNVFGITRFCNEPVKFMTKNKKGEAINFYCSYEHMIASETPISFCVKQNVLNMINMSNL